MGKEYRKMNYCINCLLPDTKPDLFFNEQGICAACISYANRKEVNWQARQQEFEDLVSGFRDNSNNRWDCVIPVSGGKDSTYQVIKVLEQGLRPLCVTSTTCDLSDIGKLNIENIKALGVDHLAFSPNPIVRRKLNKIGLTEVGDISWPEHVGIFTIPVRVATDFKIPLIVWGENSQNEYGGPEKAQQSMLLDRRWLEEFGGLLGMRVSDLTDKAGISDGDLAPYTYPSQEALDQTGVTGIFLGHFFPWDGLSNFLISQAHGFRTFDRNVEGSMVNYENLDNHQTGIHDYFKYLKFGFGRTTDIASLHIRRGRLTRSEGLDIVKLHDGKFPHSCLGKPLVDILKPIDVSLEEFEEICDRFTNKSIFKTDRNGKLIKDSEGNLTKIKYDN